LLRPVTLRSSEFGSQIGSNISFSNATWRHWISQAGCLPHIGLSSVWRSQQQARANAACDHSNPNPLSKVRIAFGVAMTHEWLNELMRTLLIGALCATLIGCACPVPQSRVVQTCTSQGCFSRIAATTPIELIEREPFRPASKITTVKPKKAAIAAKPTAAKPRNETELVEEKANSRTITEPESPAADPGAKNATTAIGRGKTEDPASDQPSETSESCS
jgi:hypothetical protein